MISSMTGFGRSEYCDEKRCILVELRSVNHRYNDLTVKMPHRYSFAEDAVKKAIRRYILRGKTECFITVDEISEPDTRIVLNTPVVEQYLENFRKLQNDFNLDGEVSIDLLAGLPDIFRQECAIDDEDEFTEILSNAVEVAAENLAEMREFEGKKLADDLLMRGNDIREMIDEIDSRAETVPSEYRKKLEERIRILTDGEVKVPEDRLAAEVAIISDKCNITEELIRLRSHMDQMETIINNGRGTVGKKLDFLVQEMNREANTIGSKTNNIEITGLMLKIKAEVEKIREQVQNIQ